MTVAGRVLDPDGKPVKGAVVDLVARPRAPWVGASDGASTIAPCSARARPTATAASSSTRPAPRRPASSRSIALGRRARVRPRLGRAEPRRRAARGRDPTPARAGRPRPAGRRHRRAGRGRRGPRPEHRPAERQGHRSTASTLWTRPARGHPRLAAAGQDRRPGADHAPRHRPRPRRQPQRPRPPLRPAGPAHRAGQGRPRQGDHPRAGAGPDHRGPRPGRRHRPAHPQRRRLGPIAVEQRARSAASSPPSSAPTTRDDSGMNPIAGESYYRSAPSPPSGEPYLIPQDEFAWTKGAVKSELRHQAPPRRLDPRQGDRGGDRSSAAGVEHPVHPRSGAATTCSRAGRRSWPARTTARSRSPSRPARDTCSSSARPATMSSSEIGTAIGSTTISPAGMRYYAHAIIPYEVKAGDPPHERRRVAPARRDDQGARRGARRPDGHRRLHPHDAPHRAVQPLLARRLTRSRSATAASSCTASTPRRPRAIYVLDPEHEWGATVELSGKQAGEDLTIRLAALRPGQGAVRRARRQAGRQASTPLRVRRHARPEPIQPEQARPGRAGGRRGTRRQRRPQALLERSASPTPRAASP